MSFRLHVFCQISFGFETEVAVLACIRSNICVGPNMLLQHGRLFAPDSTAVTDVLSSSSAPDVGVVVIGRFISSLYSSLDSGSSSVLLKRYLITVRHSLLFHEAVRGHLRFGWTVDYKSIPNFVRN